MSYKVRYRDEERTARAGFERVAHLPFIVDHRPGYHRAGSQYIIDRGLGAWRPGADDSMGAGALPTTQSIRNYAKRLANFLEWAHVRGVDVSRCTYADHILDGYQKHMLTGEWSQDGEALAIATATTRVNTAVDFLTWLGFKGERKEPFQVPRQKVRLHVGSISDNGTSKAREVTRRVGSLRVAKSQLYLPEEDQVGTWLQSVKANSGDTFLLMCESVLLFGPRESELVGARLDTLPESPSQWRVTNPRAPKPRQEVALDLTYGVKGPELGWDHGDKVGIPRTVRIPLSLAEKWHRYRIGPRNEALEAAQKRTNSWRERAQLAKEAVHLFVHPVTGRRVTQDQLYRAWKNGVLPFKQWRVHMGRDWWACRTLLEELERDKKIASFGGNVPEGLIESTATSIIQLRIQPQLGHLSQRTTFIYLQWAADYFGFPLSVKWDRYLEEGPET